MKLNIDISWSAWMTKDKEVKDIRMWIDNPRKAMIDQDKINKDDLEDLKYDIYILMLEDKKYEGNMPDEYWFQDFEIEVDYEITHSHKGFSGTRECPSEEPEIEFALYWGDFLLPEWVYEKKFDEIHETIIYMEAQREYTIMSESDEW